MRRCSAFLILALWGCATAPPMISPEVRRAASAVQLIDGAPPPGFRILGEVEGLSCSGEKSTNPTLPMARDALKMEAARRGATAVASIICQPGNFTFSDNCWKSIRCVGDAGRLP
jgi:hypothetical protein